MTPRCSYDDEEARSPFADLSWIIPGHGRNEQSYYAANGEETIAGAHAPQKTNVCSKVPILS